ncbi:MAG TPA: hypothetical protein VNG12_19560 [Acidimicrobiales bacterium]|nr:hypothetical protein [Acidimicrobiales bacterium]
MTCGFRSITVASVLGVSGLLVAACGSGSPSSGQGSTTTTTTGTSGGSSSATWPAACKLVTASDVTAGLGTAPSTPPKTDSQIECDYSNPTAYNYVNVMVQNVGSKSFFTSDANGAGATQAVSGLGDAAFQSPSDGATDTIFVLKGSNFLRIDAYVAATAANTAAVQQMARTAIGRVS